MMKKKKIGANLRIITTKIILLKVDKQITIPNQEKDINSLMNNYL